MIKTNILGKEIESSTSKVLLTDGIGGYFLYSHNNYSKYQGLFFNEEHEMFKTLDKIKLSDSKIKEIRYIGNSFVVTSDKGKEKFYVANEKAALVYESDSESESEFSLDCRDSYDMRIWGRNYNISIENGVILIRYDKKNDHREHGKREYTIFIAIAADNLRFKLKNKWANVKYEFDANRNDLHERYIFEAFSLKTKKAVIAQSLSKEKAIKTAKEIYSDSEKYVLPEIVFKNNIKDDKVKYAYNLSLNALNSLKVKRERTFGIYAGLPWFFQFWTRDSALSAKSLSKIDKEFTKRLLLFYLDNIRADGLISNRVPHAALDSIDGTGIIFLRIGEMLDDFNDNELNYIFKEFKESINALFRYHSKDLFIVNNALESWMDTESRAGACIEVQALMLNMLSLLKKLAIQFKDDETEKFAIKKEKEVLKRVKEEFFVENNLKDGLYDKTIRPNSFLAYYYYPTLLTNKQWESVFDSAIKALWLDWGGFSTIDKKDVRFCGQHTGMNNRSYHNGDSWFFLNNMAAICLNRLNENKYKKYIKSILDASTDEILNSGIFGYHAELSSAENMESNGCIGQAWSSALYIELIDEIFS